MKMQLNKIVIIKLQIDIFEVEKGGFYVRMVSNKTRGIVVLLFRALESLTEFNVQTSTLASADDETYVLSFNFQVRRVDFSAS